MKIYRNYCCKRQFALLTHIVLLYPNNVNGNVKIILHTKKIIVGIIARVFENSKYLKSIADTSVINCDEVIPVVDIVPTKKTNTVATNVTSIASINCHSKKVRDCYILQTVLLVIILLLIINIICYDYVKQKGTR